MSFERNAPWGLVNANPEEVRQVLGRFFGRDEADHSDVVTSQWAPNVDIKEEANRFVIFADVPGVDPANIDISMEKGILTLKGERAGDELEAGAKFTRSERARGVFHRRFALPDSADADGITARGKFGVLEIVIPKKAETTPRKIAIQTAD